MASVPSVIDVGGGAPHAVETMRPPSHLKLNYYFRMRLETVDELAGAVD